MAFDHKAWLRAFFRGPGYNDAAHLGVRIEAKPGAVWRCIGVHHLTGGENRGNHHIFCDVLDEEGRRLRGEKLVMEQGTLNPVYAVVDKPDNEPGTNFPLWGETAAEVTVVSVDPADKVIGLRINHADEEIGNTIGHHSFYVVFQRRPAGQPGPLPPPPQKPVARIDRIQVTVNQAWVSGLRPDERGDVTFAVEVIK